MATTIRLWVWRGLIAVALVYVLSALIVTALAHIPPTVHTAYCVQVQTTQVCHATDDHTSNVP